MSALSDTEVLRVLSLCDEYCRRRTALDAAMSSGFFQLSRARKSSGSGDVSDPRRLVITEFRVVLEPEEKHDDLGAYEVCSLYQRYFHMFYLYFCTVYDLSTEAGVAKLKNEGIALKEGCKYKFRISFRVQHEIVAGIKFVNKVRKTVFSDSDSLMIGSFPPASTAHVFEFPRYGYNEAPSGMLYRGKYSAKNSFIDSDGVKHLELEYPVDIRKSW